MQQDYLPNFLEADADSRELEISSETTQRHLSNWKERYKKYASFSKDPEFIKRCQKREKSCLQLMKERVR